MRKLFILIVLCCLLAVSCNKGTTKLKIEDDKLVSILIDVHLAEAAVQNLRGLTHDSTINLYYEQIFTIHDVTREDFESTMEFLRERPERLEAIYTEAMAEMERREAHKEGE